jgi:hypothetical protein
MIDLDLFKPWIIHLNHGHRQWFAYSLGRIVSQGYQLHETNEVTVWDGKPITFKKDDCYITVIRDIGRTEYGHRSGLVLMNEAETYEVKLSVNTPLEVVFCAVKYLHNED